MTLPTVTEQGRAPTVLETYEPGLWVAATWGDNATIRRQSRLLPKKILMTIVEESKRDLALVKPEPNATHLEAVRAAQILVGSYPKLKPHDPETYIKGLVSVFQEHSYTTAMRAVDMITRTSKYLPTRFDVVEACKSSVQSPTAKYWYAIWLAERQLEEHAERERDAAIAAQTPEQRKAIADAIMQRAGYREPTEAEREATAREFETAAAE